MTDYRLLELQSELQQVFGLRVRESIQLRPHVADQGTYLAVNLGTKGGRDRVVPIDTPQKRELIDRQRPSPRPNLRVSATRQERLPR